MPPLKIEYCSVDDMPRACDVSLDAMRRDHVFVDHSFPNHWTAPGRAVARERHVSMWRGRDPHIHHLKIRDLGLVSSTGDGEPDTSGGDSGRDIIGYGRWHIKRAGEDTPKFPEVEGDFWEDDDEKRFVKWQVSVYTERRRKAMEDAGTEKALFAIDILSAAPGYQRRGVGNLFVRWGTEQADMAGAECSVESALTAESFYARHGFLAKEKVTLTPPEKWKSKGIQEYVWMIRPAGAAKTSVK